MKATQMLHNLGQSIWLDKHYPQFADEWHIASLYRIT